jgi:hypothetical protein
MTTCYSICRILSCSGAVLVASMLAGNGASAGSDHWKFLIKNKSDHAVVEFRTQEDDEWSSNWISERIEPGDTFDMDFNTNEGSCTVRTQITFTDGSRFDANVDYCKVSTLYLYEDKLRGE